MDEPERLLREKLSLLRLVREETRKQGGFIAARDTVGLAGSVAARQALMDEIDALDGRIGGRGGDAARRLADDIAAELAAIIALDGENRSNAGALQGVLASGLKETNTARTLLAYQASPGTGSIYVNKKG